MPDSLKSEKVRNKNSICILYNRKEVCTTTWCMSLNWLQQQTTFPLLQKMMPVLITFQCIIALILLNRCIFLVTHYSLGPMYFLVQRKCGIFGVCCEALPQQINYLIDEGMCVSKGSNSVISYFKLWNRKREPLLYQWVAGTTKGK